MPNDAQTAGETAASTAEHVADTGGTVVQLQPQAGAPHPPATEADDRPTVCKLEVGGRDERGNTVEYVYARDPHYIVYFSRLDRQEPTTDAAGHRIAVPQQRGWWPFRGRGARSAAEPTNPWKGVQAQLSNDQARRRTQRKNLLGLGVERAKLQALLSDWPRRQGYDASIATALQMALDGDGSESDTSAKQALETLSDARASLLSEREVDLRAQYVGFALHLGVLGFLILLAVHLVLHLAFPPSLEILNGVWVGCEAGLIGAILSIAIGLRRRTVVLDIGIKGNRSDCMLRLIIGAVSGGTLVLLFASGLLPRLTGSQGVMDHQSIAFAMLLGIVGGFVEQLVPSLLEEQGNRLGNDPAARLQPAGGKADDGGKRA
jgi:hypothetical protein